MRTPPGKIGLYDPRHEHDSCGVSFVANLHGRSFQRTGPHRPDRADATSSTAVPPAPSPTPATAPASCCRSPTASCASRRRVRSPRRGSLRRRHRRSCRPTTSPSRRRIAAIESTMADERARGRGVGATSRPIPTCLGRHRARGDAAVQAAVRQRPRWHDRHRPRPQDVRRAQAHPSTSSTDETRRRTSRRCPPARSSTRGCSRPRSWRVLPRPDRRSHRERAAARALAASRRTRSRRGRSPTRTASSPTTARSTPSRATRTGCAPARRWSPATCSPGLAGRSRSARRVRPTRPASTRCSSCCTSAAARSTTRC